jgi:putative ABC transport system ATP-binding protein
MRDESHMTTALSIRDVTKRVDDGAARRVVLDGVSLEVEPGELVAVRGPSGSGKTTLLAVAGGMLLPTSGEVSLAGEPISRMRDAHRTDLRRKHVGFVFQDVQLIEAMTALENVLLPAVPDGLDLRARARTLLERFGVAPLADTVARKLSGGERQRVALARAMLLDPALLLLDEPSAHLDDDRVEWLDEELSSLAKDGKAVLVATHDPRICSRARALTLDRGKLVS